MLAPFVLPGERVRLRANRGVHAELLEILQPAPERAVPPCPLFTRCGGCHYQHAPYAYQLARKIEILREQLARVGKIRFEGEIPVISGPPLGYRNRAQFRVAGGQIGYLAARSHTFVPVKGECPVVSPRLNQELAAMRSRLSDARFPRFLRVLEIFTNETDVQINVIESDQPVARRFYDWCESKVALEYPTRTGLFRVSPQSFFQINRFLIDPLVEAAVGGESGGWAVDLYAGAGLFAVALARSFEKVTAIEAASAAAHDLAFNAGRAAANIETHWARVEEYLASLNTTPDFLLADPPRAGLGTDAVREILRIAPPRLTLVSCDPATLARDLAALSRYRLESLALIDLFPQTYHLETIARLRLN